MTSDADPNLRGTFTSVMAGVCTPVAVVTAMDGRRPHGTTVSAFASLSLRPPMVLVALDRDSRLLAVIRETRRFGLNVLASQQAGIARSFAGKGTAKFDGVAWTLDHGVPRLDEATGWLAGAVDELVPGGDHVIALGAVQRAAATPGQPLTYHDRVFGTHTALEGQCP